MADVALDISCQKAINNSNDAEVERLVSIMNHSDRYFMSEIIATCGQVFQNSDEWNSSDLKAYLQKWS